MTLVLGVLIFFFFISYISDSIRFEKEVKMEKPSDKCDLHKWVEHPEDGHLYCANCKMLSGFTNGEQV